MAFIQSRISFRKFLMILYYECKDMFLLVVLSSAIFIILIGTILYSVLIPTKSIYLQCGPRTHLLFGGIPICPGETWIFQIHHVILINLDSRVMYPTENIVSDPLNCQWVLLSLNYILNFSLWSVLNCECSVWDIFLGHPSLRKPTCQI